MAPILRRRAKLASSVAVCHYFAAGSGLLRLGHFVSMAAVLVLPAIFLLRDGTRWLNLNSNNNNLNIQEKMILRPTLLEPGQQMISKNEKKSLLELLPPLESAFQVLLLENAQLTLEFETSDIVEVHRFCDIAPYTGDPSTKTHEYHSFTAWATPLLRDALVNLVQQEHAVFSKLENIPEILEDMQHEFVLELLELYLTHDMILSGRGRERNSSSSGSSSCDYSNYHPTVPGHQAAMQRLLRAQEAYASSSQLPRIVFSIIAHQDVAQLERLVRAIYLPQHYIIIHLERRAPTSFVQQVQALLDKLRTSIGTNNINNTNNNAVLLQFGSIVYRTDLISHVQYRIMTWLIRDVGLVAFDYFATLDGAAFPLVTATALARHVGGNGGGGDVYLGELTHRGEPVRHAQDALVQRQKRLVYTRGGGGGGGPQDDVASLKLHKRLPRSLFPTSTTDNNDYNNNVLSNAMVESLRFKSVSGNQGIYSRKLVRDLVSNTDVRQLFALSKYGCCCCLEERTWIAALYRIGALPMPTSLDDTTTTSSSSSGFRFFGRNSMFQLWGGNTENQCQGSMSNALLSKNASLCYRNEHVMTSTTTTTTASTSAGKTSKQQQQQPRYFWGNETWNMLVQARREGFLFARKFHSDHAPSMELLQEIQQFLWTEEIIII